MAEANVAVLIDFENVGLDAIQYLLDQLSDVGRVIIKRAYADWSAQRGKQDQLLELGMEAIHQYHSAKSGKNLSDIRLAIDAVDLLYTSPIDTFVLVSSDSDFVPLVSKLRSAGKSVIAAGRRDATSPMLVRSCDRFVYLDDVMPATVKRKKPQSRQALADSLVVRAVEASMDDQGQVVGSKLYQTMLRIDPGFNFRARGHRTFAQFLSSCRSVRMTRPRDGGDVIIQLSNSREQAVVNSNEAEPSADWEREVDEAWARRQRRKISGRAAATDAAKVLGVPKLSGSRYPSLDKLLAASKLLYAGWRREGNAIIKK